MGARRPSSANPALSGKRLSASLMTLALLLLISSLSLYAWLALRIWSLRCSLVTFGMVARPTCSFP